MRNILKIFDTDTKKILSSFLATVVIVGVCFLPSLYAWFNIYSNWDPYASTSNIHIAISNDDKGITADDGTVTNMGDSVVEELHSNDQIGWVFTDTETAIHGVQSGDYYACVIISPEFTYRMYNVLDEGFQKPTITYYENEKKNAIATKITDAAISSLTESINETFIVVVTETIFNQTNDFSEDLKESETVEELEAKIIDLNDRLLGYSSTIDSVLAGNAALCTEVGNAKEQAAEAREGIATVNGNLVTTQNSLAKTQTTLNDFSLEVTETLNQIQNSIDTISDDIASTDLAGDAQRTAESIEKTATDTAILIEQLTHMDEMLSELEKSTDLTDEERERIADARDAISSITDGTTNIQDSLAEIQPFLEPDAETAALAAEDEDNSALSELIANSVLQKQEQIESALAVCSKSVENINNTFTSKLVPEMNSILDSMALILNNVSTLLNSLDKTLADTDKVLDSVVETVDATNESLENIQATILDVSDSLTKIVDKLDSAAEDERIGSLISVLDGDPEEYGDFFSQIVQVDTNLIYPIETYGSAIAPFYTVLAIWVGALILVSIIKVKALPRGISNLKSYELYFGRYLLFFVLGQIQTLIIVLGNIFLLHCQILHPIMFWGACSIISLTFTLLIYSLTISFGDVGKALAVVILVIQIAGSGGTYPIEILPSFYRNVYIFFPFPYAIDALRECVGGMYSSSYDFNMSIMWVFIGISLLIGLVIRIPFVGVNHFVEERLEDTKLM